MRKKVLDKSFFAPSSSLVSSHPHFFHPIFNFIDFFIFFPSFSHFYANVYDFTILTLTLDFLLVFTTQNSSMKNKNLKPKTITKSILISIREYKYSSTQEYLPLKYLSVNFCLFVMLSAVLILYFKDIKKSLQS